MNKTTVPSTVCARYFLVARLENTRKCLTEQTLLIIAWIPPPNPTQPKKKTFCRWQSCCFMPLTSSQ